MHHPRVLLVCGTMWLEETANHWEEIASQAKGPKLACLVEQKLSHTCGPS